MIEAQISVDSIVSQIKQKKLLIVNPRRKNGLIIYKRYYAEFAGPGAVIGSEFDEDIVALIPVGKLSLVIPQNSQEKINAYLIRRQWIRLTKQITDNPIPLQRAQVILNQFENWFDAQTISELPDQAFAMLVGVLPQTIRRVRDEFERL
ncbi:MAG: hypothetical protein RLZZ148_1088 [Cyanobacteriota bacterium]